MKSQVSEWHLNDVELFSRLSDQELSHLKAYLKRKDYAKGETLFLETNLCERIFIIRSGRVKIFRSSTAGREQIIDILGPGQTCACNPGDINWTCSASGIALTNCQAWYLSHHDYVQLMQTNISLAQSLNRLLANKLCRLNRLLEQMSLEGSEKRLVRFLIDTYENGVEQNLSKDGVYIALSHEQMGCQLGVARETITRHLHRLKEMNLIAVTSRKVSVPNLSALRSYLETLN